MLRLNFNPSTFSASLESVNSWGVHCFFLHLHLLSFIHEVFACLDFLGNNEQLLLPLDALRQTVILLLSFLGYPLQKEHLFSVKQGKNV